MAYTLFAANVIVVSVIFSLCALAAVCGRLAARRKQKSSLGWDDWSIMLALFFSWALAAESIYGASAGAWGLEALQMTPLQLQEMFALIFASILLHLTCLALIKASFLLFYKRIFITNKFQWTANIILGVIAGWWLSFFIGQLLIDTPLHDFWVLGVHAQHNFNDTTFLICLAAFDVALDILIMILPLPVISGLHVQSKQRYQLMGIFSIGIFCTVAGSIRIYYLWANSALSSPADPAFASILTNAEVWSVIETNTSIIVACLPTMGPILKTWRAPESLVRSVRSIFSLRSMGSEDRSRQAGSGPSKTDKNGTTRIVPGQPGTDSETLIESNMATNEAAAAGKNKIGGGAYELESVDEGRHGDTQSESASMGENQNGIAVTKGFSVD